MGGELDVITAPRRGTTMRVSLPLAVAADRAQAAEAGIHDRG
jgi:chemotaxis protein histidine kinase CheA